MLIFTTIITINIEDDPYFRLKEMVRRLVLILITFISTQRTDKGWKVNTKPLYNLRKR